jgi:DNA-binding NtrC family response regulator
MTSASACKVLVIEDEGMVAMLLEEMLADLGHQVVATVGKIETAKKWIGEGDFDFAVLDVNLNGTHTYPLADMLKGRGIPFLFATGYGTGGLRPEWSDAPVLQKPFQLRQLQESIGRLKQVR